MYFQESVELPAGEVHCYFPEWADRPQSTRTTSESRQNSYMAGGYAEEFGYLSCISCPSVLPPIQGNPEYSSLWHVQKGGLHPGYPECARPLDRIHSAADLDLMPDRHSKQPAANVRFGKAEVRFTAVPVKRSSRASATSRASWWRAWRILRRGMSSAI